MRKFLTLLLSVLMVLATCSVLPVYAWNKTATYPNGLTGVAAGNAQDVRPLWDNPNIENWQNLASPFTFDSTKYAPGKVTGRLPMMGFNTWNHFRSAIREEIIMGIADSFIRLGLDKVGYQYVVIDDGCYQRDRSRNEDGTLRHDTTYFPSGFKFLTDYVHNLGLKMGMYNDVGTATCNSMCAASWGFEDLDAMTYAKWGVDYIKYDFCNNPWAAAPNLSAPNIRGIRVTGTNDFSVTLNAVADGVIGQGNKSYPFQTGMSVTKNTSGNYVSGLTCNTGTNGTTGDLKFTINAPATGTYELSVEYAVASDTTNRWLQADVNGVRVIDGKQPNTGNASVYVYNAPTQVTLNAGENTIRLYCEKRREIGMEQYAAFFDSIQKAKAAYPGWDMIYSLCEWGNNQPWLWAWKLGDSWRTTGDIAATWDSMRSVYSQNVILDEYAGIDKGWNDPDMLEVANGTGVFVASNYTENETHFNLWCMMNAPLMLGADLREVEYGDDTWKIITNKDAIALNQDPLGIQAKRVKIIQGATSPDPRLANSTASRVDFIAKPLANNDIALMITNLADSANAVEASITIDEIINGTSQWGVGIGSKMKNKDAFAAVNYYKLCDIGAKSKSAIVISKDEPISVALRGHASKMFRITPFKPGDDFVGIAAEIDKDITAYFGVNNADGRYKGYMILATYNDKMALQSVASQAFSVEAPYFYGTLRVPAPGPRQVVKAFLWDANFAPIRAATTHTMPGPDKSALYRAIARASMEDMGRYTRLTANGVTDALEVAKAVYKEKDSSPGSIAEATFALNTAFNDLIQAPTEFILEGQSYVKLTGRLYGPPESWGDLGDSFEKLFDGNLQTYYDAPGTQASTAYGGIDLGAGNESNVDLIRFYPRPGYLSRSNNCTFRGSNTDNAGGNVGTILHRVSGVTELRWYNITTIDSTEKFRYLWLMSGSSSQGNMTEVEFYVKGDLKVDRTLLDDRISFASTLVQTDYTVLSWGRLQIALKTATTLPADASQDQVDSAASALKAAIKSLV